MQSEVQRARFGSDLKNDPREQDIVVMDASYWIIEGRRGDEYKIIQRSPPDLEKDRELIRLGERLLEVAGFDLEDLGLVDLLEDMSHAPSEGSRSRRAPASRENRHCARSRSGSGRPEAGPRALVGEGKRRSPEYPGRRAMRPRPGRR
jgi:hypothetical protein